MPLPLPLRDRTNWMHRRHNGRHCVRPLIREPLRAQPVSTGSGCRSPLARPLVAMVA